MKVYKRETKVYLRKVKPELIEKGAIFAHVAFCVPTPEYLLNSKKGRLEMELEHKYCGRKSDLSNYLKAVADTAEDILYKNDGQTAVMVCQKLYNMWLRTKLEVTSLEERV